MLSLNRQLYNLCKQNIEQHINEVQQKIDEAQDAANNETKSSAGDKYETTREMMQQEINRELARLYELKKSKAALDMIPLQPGSLQVQPGNIVCTNNGNYYIAISAGQIFFNEKMYHAISAATPLGAKLLGLRKGESFTINLKRYEIIEIT